MANAPNPPNRPNRPRRPIYYGEVYPSFSGLRKVNVIRAEDPNYEAGFHNDIEQLRHFLRLTPGLILVTDLLLLLAPENNRYEDAKLNQIFRAKHALSLAFLILVSKRQYLLGNQHYRPVLSDAAGLFSSIIDLKWELNEVIRRMRLALTAFRAYMRLYSRYVEQENGAIYATALRTGRQAQCFNELRREYDHLGNQIDPVDLLTKYRNINTINVDSDSSESESEAATEIGEDNDDDNYE